MKNIHLSQNWKNSDMVTFYTVLVFLPCCTNSKKKKKNRFGGQKCDAS